MIKIIVADRIIPYFKHESHQERDEIKIFPAGSNEEILKIHDQETADLIITLQSWVGMSGVGLCSLIRTDKDRREVSVIVYCRNNSEELDQVALCRTNVVMTLPVDSRVLSDKVHQLLNIPPRSSCRMPFSARFANHSFISPISCCTENISATGMLIESNESFGKGDRLNCSLALPNAKSLEMKAEIVRTVKNTSPFDPNWYGIKFHDVAPEARQAIEALVNKNKTAQRRVSNF